MVTTDHKTKCGAHLRTDHANGISQLPLPEYSPGQMQVTYARDV